MSNTIGPVRLTELCEAERKLNAPLHDPQPGMFTWHQFLKERLDELAALGKRYTQHGLDANS